MKHLYIFLFTLLSLSFKTDNTQIEIQLLSSMMTGNSVICSYCTKNVTVAYFTKDMERAKLYPMWALDSLLHSLYVEKEGGIQFRNYKQSKLETTFDVVYNCDDKPVYHMILMTENDLLSFIFISKYSTK